MFNNKKPVYTIIRRMVSTILLFSFIATSSDAAFALAPSSRLMDKDLQDEFTIRDLEHTIVESLYMKMSLPGIRDMIKRRAGEFVPITLYRTSDGAVSFNFRKSDGNTKYVKVSIYEYDANSSDVIKLTSSGNRTYWRQELSSGLRSIEAEAAYDAFVENIIRYAIDAVDYANGALQPNDEVAKAARDRYEKLFVDVPGIITTSSDELKTYFSGSKQDRFKSERPSLIKPFSSLSNSERLLLLTWHKSSRSDSQGFAPLPDKRFEPRGGGMDVPAEKELQMAQIVKGTSRLPGREELIYIAAKIRTWVMEPTNSIKKQLCNGMGLAVSLGIENARAVWRDELFQTWVEVGDESGGWLIDAYPEGAPGEVLAKTERWIENGVLVMPLSEGRKIYGNGTIYVPSVLARAEATKTIIEGTSYKNRLDFILNAKGVLAFEADKILRKAMFERFNASTKMVQTAAARAILEVTGSRENIEAAKVVDALELSEDDRVLCVGAGTQATHPVACAVYTNVDIVQPDIYTHTDGSWNQREEIKKEISRKLAGIKRTFGMDLESRIDADTYRGLAEYADLPLRNYSHIFLLNVLDDKTTENHRGLIHALLRTMRNEAVVLISAYNEKYDAVSEFRRIAESAGYEVTQDRAFYGGQSPVYALKVRRFDSAIEDMRGRSGNNASQVFAGPKPTAPNIDVLASKESGSAARGGASTDVAPAKTGILKKGQPKLWPESTYIRKSPPPLGLFELLLTINVPLNVDQIATKISWHEDTVEKDLRILAKLELVESETIETLSGQQKQYHINDEVRKRSEVICKALNTIATSAGKRPDTASLEAIKPKIDQILSSPVEPHLPHREISNTGSVKAANLSRSLLLKDARRIMAANKPGRQRTISADEEKLLFTALNRAYEELDERVAVELEDYLVRQYDYVVRRVVEKFKGKGIDTGGDSLQDGRGALVVTIRKYDPDVGTPFEYFAKPFVSGAIKDGLETILYIVHLPYHIVSRLSAMNYAIEELAKEGSFDMSMTQMIAERMSRNTGKRFTAQEVAELLAKKESHSVSSLDKLSSDDGKSGSLHDVVPAPRVATYENISFLLSYLTWEERVVIKLIYGHGTTYRREYTPKEAVKIIGCSEKDIVDQVATLIPRLNALIRGRALAKPVTSIEDDGRDIFIAEVLGINPRNPDFNIFVGISRKDMLAEIKELDCDGREYARRKQVSLKTSLPISMFTNDFVNNIPEEFWYFYAFLYDGRDGRIDKSVLHDASLSGLTGISDVDARNMAKSVKNIIANRSTGRQTLAKKLGTAASQIPDAEIRKLPVRFQEVLAIKYGLLGRHRAKHNEMTNIMSERLRGIEERGRHGEALTPSAVLAITQKAEARLAYQVHSSLAKNLAGYKILTSLRGKRLTPHGEETIGIHGKALLARDINIPESEINEARLLIRSDVQKTIDDRWYGLDGEPPSVSLGAISDILLKRGLRSPRTGLTYSRSSIGRLHRQDLQLLKRYASGWQWLAEDAGLNIKDAQRIVWGLPIMQCRGIKALYGIDVQRKSTRNDLWKWCDPLGRYGSADKFYANVIWKAMIKLGMHLRTRGAGADSEENLPSQSSASPHPMDNWRMETHSDGMDREDAAALTKNMVLVSDLVEDEIDSYGISKLVSEAQKEAGFWKGWEYEYWGRDGRDALVLLDGGKAVAIWSYFRESEDYAHCDGIYVAKSYRGSGLGRSMRVKMLGHLAGAGFTKFRVGGSGINAIRKDPAAQGLWKWTEGFEGKGVEIKRDGSFYVSIDIDIQKVLGIQAKLEAGSAARDGVDGMSQNISAEASDGTSLISKEDRSSANPTIYARLRLARNRYLLRMNEKRLAALDMKTVPTRYYRGDKYSYEKLLFSKVNPFAYFRRAIPLIFRISSLKKRIEADLPSEIKEIRGTSKGSTLPSGVSQSDTSPISPQVSTKPAAPNMTVPASITAAQDKTDVIYNEICASPRITGGRIAQIAEEMSGIDIDKARIVASRLFKRAKELDKKSRNTKNSKDKEAVLQDANSIYGRLYVFLIASKANPAMKENVRDIVMNRYTDRSAGGIKKTNPNRAPILSEVQKRYERVFESIESEDDISKIIIDATRLYSLLENYVESDPETAKGFARKLLDMLDDINADEGDDEEYAARVEDIEKLQASLKDMVEEKTNLGRDAEPGSAAGEEAGGSSMESKARRLAIMLKDFDLMGEFVTNLSAEQRRARMELANYPINGPLSDFIRLSSGSRDYHLAVIALSFNRNLLNYELVREAYMQVRDEPVKRKDMVKILRCIQFNAVFFENKKGVNYKFINRRTWPGRADGSMDAIRDRLADFRRVSPTDTFIIGDFAVSDGTSSLELAENLFKENVKIVASDKTTCFWSIQFREEVGGGRTYIFDPSGNLLQVVTEDGKVVDGLSLDEDFKSILKGLFDEWLKSGNSSDFRKARKVSLINPEAEEFAKKHPDILEFRAHDIFSEISEKYHFIRVLGLLMRDGSISYLTDDQRAAALKALGRGLFDGGIILNGTFWKGGGQFDLYRRSGNKLISYESVINNNRSIGVFERTLDLLPLGWGPGTPHITQPPDDSLYGTEPKVSRSPIEATSDRPEIGDVSKRDTPSSGVSQSDTSPVSPQVSAKPAAPNMTVPEFGSAVLNKGKLFSKVFADNTFIEIDETGKITRLVKRSEKSEVEILRDWLAGETDEVVRAAVAHALNTAEVDSAAQDRTDPVPPRESPRNTNNEQRTMNDETAYEVDQAETLANRIKILASEAKREKAKVIVGIETSGWVPDEQKSDMQALVCEVKQLVDTMKRRGMLDNITVVLGNSETLLTNIANEKPGKSDKIVVLGSEKTLTSDSYKALEAFKACIDLRELGNLDYISLLEVLTVALNLGLGGDTQDASRSAHPGIGIETIGERIVRLIPSKKVDINEPSKVYRLQIKELAKQA